MKSAHLRESLLSLVKCGTTPFRTVSVMVVWLRSAITAAFAVVLFAGCSNAPEINGTFDVSFVWRDGKLQSTKVNPIERTRTPSALQSEGVAKLSESYIADEGRAANLNAASGVCRITVLGRPPYLVQVASVTITEPDFSQLKMAVEQENTEEIRTLVRRYGNVNQRELPSRQSALSIAAAGRHDKSLRSLLDLGADVNGADHIGITPLMNAVAANDATAVRMLITSGANTAATNKAGQSALSLAQDLHRDSHSRLAARQPGIAFCSLIVVKSR